MGTGVHVRIGSSPVSPTKKNTKIYNKYLFFSYLLCKFAYQFFDNRLMAAWCNGSHAGLKILSAPGETLDVEPS